MTYSRQESDLIIIGAGLTGLSATAFAVARGLKTVQIGLTAGELPFASGLLDLLGIHPVAQQYRWEDPWAGIASLMRDRPEHPYARVGLENIRNGWKEFLTILKKAGLRYCGRTERNSLLTTCTGTPKITYQVPENMWPGVIGLEKKHPALIVDFEGMKDFSAVQLVKTIGSQWPGLRARRLRFPHSFRGMERQNLFMAEALRSFEIRSALAEAIGPYLEDAQLVGMPAILGMQQPEVVAADLKRLLGVTVFEIPTMPPSVPGHRLKQTIEQELHRRGAVIVSGRKALAVNTSGRRCLSVVVEAGRSHEALKAGGIVLATGRFLGGGLAASRTGVHETILDLPVHQPERRQDWHRHRFMDPHGHPINQAGLEVDGLLRPLGNNGKAAYDNLFAAGSVLAHQDWKRMKCGAGLAIATAYGAIQSFIHCSAR
jgi:glycerol-3-phosphate dehydrogenase subunit B